MADIGLESAPGIDTVHRSWLRDRLPVRAKLGRGRYQPHLPANRVRVRPVLPQTASARFHPARLAVSATSFLRSAGMGRDRGAYRRECDYRLALSRRLRRGFLLDRAMGLPPRG